jgi:hypothetical protein
MGSRQSSRMEQILLPVRNILPKGAYVVALPKATG